MNTNFFALASIAAVGLLTSCQCPFAGSAPGLTVRPTANDTNAIVFIKPAHGALGKIIRLDPALDALLPSGAKLEKLAEGFDWSEGPVWMPGNYLLFSDVPLNTIFAWRPEGVTTFALPEPIDILGLPRR